MVIKKCLYCNNDFKVDNYRKDTAKYCSKDCYWKGKSSYHNTKNCLFCNVEFNVTDYDKDKKYCSLECYWNDSKIKIKKVCKNCGVEYSTYSPDFCSKKCYFEHKRMNSKKSNCEYCNDEFKRTNKNQKYCSRECYWNFRRENSDIKFQSNQGKNLITLECEICKEDFKVNNYRKDTAKYCSVSCRLKSGYNISNFSINVSDEIKKMDSELKEEYCLSFDKRRIFPDILIGNKIIECFGDYWHCNPDIYEDGYYNKRTKMNSYEIQNRDEERIDFLIENGYNVLVI